MQEAKTKGAQSLRKALGILNIVGSHSSAMSRSDVITASGLPRPTAYRMIAALAEEGFLSHDEQRKTVSLGTRLLHLAQQVWSDGDLRQSAVGELERLARGGNGAALLMVRSNDMMSCIELKPAEGFDTRWHVGATEPIVESVAGQALLAFADWQEIDQTLETLITGAEEKTRAIKTELAVARSRFYAVSEAAGGSIWSVAAPIFDFSGQPIAAISLHARRGDDSGQTIHDMGAAVVQAARRISSMRGGYPFGIDVPVQLPGNARSSTQLVVDSRCLIGDSPIIDNGKITWIDILAPAVHRYDVDLKTHTETALSEVAGALIPLPNQELLLAEQVHIRVLDRDLSEVWRRQVRDLPPGFRFNDGALDASGRIWLGAMDMATSRGTGFLLRYNDHDAAPMVLPGFSLPNGIAFDPSGKTMFVVDSMERNLSILSYEQSTGEADLVKRVPLLTGEDGRPSGLAIGSDGSLYTGHWDGASVLRLSADGEIMERYRLPVPRPSGLAIDEDTSTIFVTTARVRLSDRDLNRFPSAGAVYSLPV